MSDPISVPGDPAASPFRLVIDPDLRASLRGALLDLIANHDHELEQHAADGFLQLDTTKEYIELLARHLRDTLGTRDGIAYLLGACGLHVPHDDIQLNPQPRWKVQRTP